MAGRPSQAECGSVTSVQEHAYARHFLLGSVAPTFVSVRVTVHCSILAHIEECSCHGRVYARTCALSHDLDWNMRQLGGHLADACRCSGDALACAVVVLRCVSLAPETDFRRQCKHAVIYVKCARLQVIRAGIDSPPLQKKISSKFKNTSEQ